MTVKVTGNDVIRFSTKVIIGGVMSMSAMVVWPKDIDDAMVGRLIKAIGLVESGGDNLGVHPDGVSCGRYGVTQVAVDELKSDRVRRKYPSCYLDGGVYDLTWPEINELVARKYLLYMYLRHKTWWKAVGWYHGGDELRRDRYAGKVMALVEPDRERFGAVPAGK